jgi:hypothetical protein
LQEHRVMDNPVFAELGVIFGLATFEQVPPTRRA